MLSKAFIVCVLDERIVFISPDFNLNEYPYICPEIIIFAKKIRQ